MSDPVIGEEQIFNPRQWGYYEIATEKKYPHYLFLWRNNSFPSVDSVWQNILFGLVKILVYDKRFKNQTAYLGLMNEEEAKVKETEAPSFRVTLDDPELIREKAIPHDMIPPFEEIFRKSNWFMIPEVELGLIKSVLYVWDLYFLCYSDLNCTKEHFGPAINRALALSFFMDYINPKKGATKLYKDQINFDFLKNVGEEWFKYRPLFYIEAKNPIPLAESVFVDDVKGWEEVDEEKEEDLYDDSKEWEGWDEGKVEDPDDDDKEEDEEKEEDKTS